MKQKILLIDEGTSRTEMFTETLNQVGFEVAGRISYEDDILAGMKICEPDLLLIDMESPDQYIFNQLSEINKVNPKPIVFFAEKSEEDVIKKAVKSGVSAFIVDGLTGSRLKPVIELAIARFDEMQSLYEKLAASEVNLEERKTVERAKGIIMSRKKLSEDEAYNSLRTLAMSQNKKLFEIAKNVIEMSELF